MKQPSIPAQLQPLVDARGKFCVSHAQSQFIAQIYAKRFGKQKADIVRTIEEMAAVTAAQKQAKKVVKERKRMMRGRQQGTPGSPESSAQHAMGD